MKTYIKLSLCFILVCIIYIGIIPKNEQKTTENVVKEEEKNLPSEVVINEEKQDEVVEVVEEPKEYINYEQRLDLFVSSKNYAIDRSYKGNNTISVFKEEK